METTKNIDQLNSIIDKNHEEFNNLNSKFLNQSQELHEVTNNHQELLRAYQDLQDEFNTTGSETNVAKSQLQTKIDNLNFELDQKNTEISKKINEINSTKNQLSDLQTNLECRTNETTTSILQLETLKEYISHVITSLSQSTMLKLNNLNQSSFEEYSKNLQGDFEAIVKAINDKDDNMKY